MSDAMMDGLSAGELATVVELQRVELDRLLREHRRLNDRIDQMLRLQERESRSCGSRCRPHSLVLPSSGYLRQRTLKGLLNPANWQIGCTEPNAVSAR